MRITVTGAYGKAGRAVVADLLEHGHQVVATDLVGTPGAEAGLGADLMIADLTDYGQAIEVLAGSDAVVHLGNIPAPGRTTEPESGPSERRCPRRSPAREERGSRAR